MIIGLTGYKQSGKSTASKYLREKHGFVQHNFKDALIDEIKTYFPDFVKKECELYNCSPEELFDRKPGHIRQLMQNFGTEVRRGHDPAYWIKKWEEARPDGDVVVDDCRFLNEFAKIRHLGGSVIRIVKNGQPKEDGHLSETEQNQIIPDDIVCVDVGEHEKMYRQLDIIINNIRKFG